MKHLFKHLAPLLAFLLVVGGCGGSQPDPQAPKVETELPHSRVNKFGASIIKVRACEYVWIQRQCCEASDVLIHAGDCSNPIHAK